MAGCHELQHTKDTNCSTTPRENSPWSHVLPGEGVLNGRCEKTHGTRKTRGLHRPGNGILRMIMVVFAGGTHDGGCC
jgi:hypothetical protein